MCLLPHLLEPQRGRWGSFVPAQLLCLCALLSESTLGSTFSLALERKTAVSLEMVLLQGCLCCSSLTWLLFPCLASVARAMGKARKRQAQPLEIELGLSGKLHFEGASAHLCWTGAGQRQRRFTGKLYFTFIEQSRKPQGCAMILGGRSFVI